MVISFGQGSVITVLTVYNSANSVITVLGGGVSVLAVGATAIRVKVLSIDSSLKRLKVLKMLKIDGLHCLDC